MDTIWTILGSVGVVLAVGCFLLVVVASWAATLIGLPGNWIIAAAATIYAYLSPDAWRIDIGWPWIVALFALAAIGEALEFSAGAVGTQRAGGSRRSAIFALLGSMIGGLFGMFVAMPIPLVGPIIGALLFGGLGAALGAFFGEMSHGTDAEKTVKVSWGAFWGRLLGTGAKTLVGCVMVAAVLVAMIWP